MRKVKPRRWEKEKEQAVREYKQRLACRRFNRPSSGFVFAWAFSHLLILPQSRARVRSLSLSDLRMEKHECVHILDLFLIFFFNAVVLANKSCFVLLLLSWLYHLLVRGRWSKRVCRKCINLATKKILLVVFGISFLSYRRTLVEKRKQGRIMPLVLSLTSRSMALLLRNLTLTMSFLYEFVKNKLKTLSS